MPHKNCCPAPCRNGCQSPNGGVELVFIGLAIPVQPQIIDVESLQVF
jgi:hypothetical protein